MEKANSLKISILDKVYQVTTDESRENILEASKLVDSLLREKTKSLSLAGDARVPVIVALELATEIGKLKQLPQIWQDKITQLNNMIEVALQ
jgi:cell division protein ZapA (FtsZ GTPase activity inhibitor)